VGEISSKRLATVTMQSFLQKEKNFINVHILFIGVEVSMEQLKAKADQKNKIIFMMLPDSDPR